MEEAERAGKGCEAEKSAGEDVVAEEGVEGEEDIVDKDDVTQGQDINATDDEEERDSEGGAGDVTVDVEGETPEEFVEGETPRKVVEEDTPVGTDERDPGEGKSPMNTEVEEPESDGLKDIVDLVDGSDSENTPVKERVARRMTRRSSVLDEVDGRTQPRKLQFGAQGAEVEIGKDVPASEERISLRQKRDA